MVDKADKFLVVPRKGANGQPYSVSAEFLEIQPPRKLVQTWSYDWDKTQAPTRLTYTLEDIPGGTRVVVRHEGFATAEACGSHSGGWELVLGWLVSHLEQASS
jgi:uncharacterized protein YndB with AHSA1/START domain